MGEQTNYQYHQILQRAFISRYLVLAPACCKCSGWFTFRGTCFPPICRNLGPSFGRACCSPPCFPTARCLEVLRAINDVIKKRKSALKQQGASSRLPHQGHRWANTPTPFMVFYRGTRATHQCPLANSRQRGNGRWEVLLSDTDLAGS